MDKINCFPVQGIVVPDYMWCAMEESHCHSGLVCNCTHSAGASVLWWHAMAVKWQ